MRLSGRTALITGSTSGLGKVIAQTFHSSGAGVVITGLGDESDIAVQCADLRRTNKAPVVFSSADFACPKQRAGLLEEIRRQGTVIDILINNAGAQHVSSIETFPPEEWDRLLAINLSAPFHLIRALLGGMKERGWGRIINISSVHGLVGSSNKSAYVASKHGLVGLTKAVALEAAGSGVTCNAICPGLLMTPLSNHQIAALGRELNISFEEATERLLRDKQPSMQAIPLQEIAALAVYLCGDSANQITGTALPVDGAWTAR